MCGEGEKAKDVGIGNSRDGDGIGEADGGLTAYWLNPTVRTN